MTQIAATYISEWDGGYQIATKCLIDIDTGLVTPEVCDSLEINEVNTLDREFIQLDSGAEFDIEENGHNQQVIADIIGFRSSITGALNCS